METRHAVHVADAREMADLDDDSVELVVTSPPYPMVEMWDELFGDLSPDAGRALEDCDGERAFEAMHGVLDEVWAEVSRVLVPGGVACVNVGDATRTVDGSFRVFPNHQRVLSAFTELGFDPLPDVLWRKPSNSPSKFVGSGTLPPNAYVTLEHEYVLVLRNGSERRSFEPGARRRYESAFFWEERNEWFSDLWEDVQGAAQELDDDARARSAAFPLAIPYRLVNMYSVYGDTVLDPFWGTGTTSVAAMLAGRNSVGYELVPAFRSVFEERLETVEDRSRERVRERLDDHRAFVADCRAAGGSLGYDAEHYDFPVKTKQETEIRLYAVEDWEETAAGYVAQHAPVDLSTEL